MTDTQWQSVIDKCYKAGREHLRLLDIAEKEYEKRYGFHPSDVDDDWWIDTLHYCNGDTDLGSIKSSAESIAQRRRLTKQGTKNLEITSIKRQG